MTSPEVISFLMGRCSHCQKLWPECQCGRPTWQETKPTYAETDTSPKAPVEQDTI